LQGIPADLADEKEKLNQEAANITQEKQPPALLGYLDFSQHSALILTLKSFRTNYCHRSSCNTQLALPALKQPVKIAEMEAGGEKSNRPYQKKWQQAFCM